MLAIRKKHKEKIRRSKTERVIFIIVGILFTIYALTLIYPFIWAILTSLKTNKELHMNSPFDMPQNFLIDNYFLAFRELNIRGNNMFQMIFNSLWFSIGGTVINIFICCMSSYVVAKYEFKGRKFIYNLALFLMLLPIVGSLPAQYKLVHELKLDNSPLFLLTCTGGFGFNFIVLHSFFKSLSWEYAEAAFIDGASHFQVFYKVMLPQAIGPVFSLALIQGIGFWNDYMTPMLYLPDFPTLANGLFEYEREMIQGSNIPIYFAGLVMSMIPILILFAVFQNTIMEKTTMGGLKG